MLGDALLLANHSFALFSTKSKEQILPAYLNP
jgi:hypothetical protein